MERQIHTLPLHPNSTNDKSSIILFNNMHKNIKAQIIKQKQSPWWQGNQYSQKTIVYSRRYINNCARNWQLHCQTLKGNFTFTVSTNDSAALRAPPCMYLVKMWLKNSITLILIHSSNFQRWFVNMGIVCSSELMNSGLNIHVAATRWQFVMQA